MDTIIVVIIFMLCFFVIMIWNLDRTEKVERLLLESLNRANSRLDQVEREVKNGQERVELDLRALERKLEEIRVLLARPKRPRGRPRKAKK